MSTIARSACCGVVILLLALPGGAAGGPAFEVQLAVSEPQGISRQQEPISGGIPLPRGQFPAGQSFALFRADGSELPCQSSPLVVEADGTLRWVLVDFQDDVAAGATNRYVLRAAKPAAAPAATLKIADTPEAVAVDTGRIKFVVSKKKPFGLFDTVAAGSRSIITGGEVSYQEMQGRKGWDDSAAWKPAKFVAGPPESVLVHYAGPVRATVEVRGHFAGDPLGAGYQAWITAWAGQSRVLVKYKLCNSNSDQYTAILVRRSTIELRLAAEPQQVVLGAKQPVLAGPSGWMHQGLLMHANYQDVPGSAKAGSGERVLWTAGGPEDRPGGWIAGTGASRWFVADRLFAANPARRLAAEGRSLVLEGIARPFEAPPDTKASGRRLGQPWQADGFWLYDCSHHTSEYLFDFDPPEATESLDPLARAGQGRLWAIAPGAWYSQCEVLGGGRFGTLDDEEAAYRAWGWKFQPEQAAANTPRPAAGAFVGFEDNHYESEADSVEGLLLMYLRTGRREWFDLAEAWARYHMDLQAWRTDGWAWKDGAIWFPSGGPQGNMQVRQAWNFAWGPNWGNREKNPDCIDLWRHSQAKSCYCHFYGSGLADFFCLTGDPDALQAARDNVEQKDEEFRRFRKFVPGESEIGCIRGFGRGFEVMMRVLEADPGNEKIRDLARLCARTLWQSPVLDERGFHPSHLGGGFSGMPAKEISPPVKKWMDDRGIRFTTTEGTVDRLTKGDQSWPVSCYGGTWQHVYIQNGADLYARYFDDEDLRDFVIGFAEMSARYMLSPKCHQTWYYTYFDVPDRGMVFDPWALEHIDTQDGEGCVHSGWYTRFYPDACAKGYSLTGEKPLLDRSRDFWYYGSKREYQTRHLEGPADTVHQFAGHVPPKDDTVLSTVRVFYEASHPRTDDQPPGTIADLSVRLLGSGEAEVRFTAPADRGGGKVARYQVKAAPLPIVDYPQWDPARDPGKRRNWWRATNCRGEPLPGAPGTKERFVVRGVPEGRPLYFAVRSFDTSQNRSPLGNVAAASGP